MHDFYFEKLVLNIKKSLHFGIFTISGIHYPRGTFFIFSAKGAMDKLFFYRTAVQNTFFLECSISSFWYFIPIKPCVSGLFLFTDLKFSKVSALGETSVHVRDSVFLYRIGAASVPDVPGLAGY